MKNIRLIATFCAAAALAAPGVFAQQAAQAPQAPQPPQPPRAHIAGAVGPSSPFLGVGLMDVDDARARALKMKETRGAEITQLAPGGPAEKAGLKVGDVILEYDGQHVQSQEQLQRMVHESVPGRAVKIGVWRNGALQNLDVTIESRRGLLETRTLAPEIWSEIPPPGVNWPPSVQFPMDFPRIMTIVQSPVLGVECEPLGDEQQFAEYFGVKDGLLVKMVGPDTAAARAGIKAGDVIVKVDDTRVGTMRELTTALRTARQKGNYQVTVVRNKKEMPIAVQAQ